MLLYEQTVCLDNYLTKEVNIILCFECGFYYFSFSLFTYINMFANIFIRYSKVSK